MEKRLFLLLLFFKTLIMGNLFAQTISISVSGKVMDARTGEALVGVSVVVKGTSQGAITDLQGFYKLEKLPPNARLQFSYIGYLSKEIAVGQEAIGDILLEEETSTLKEVVVVGYGTQRKSDLTGAVGSVKGKDLQSIATPSVTQALQGKIAGVLVTPSSGTPGASAVIRVRGTGTLNDANPFFVVDGMLLDDINFLNPNDIESVEVLKDASATAIYGSRGANGVIIVTTKKGSAKQKATISLNSYYGQQSLMKTIPLANGTEYATLRNEAAKNQGLPAPFANPEQYGEGTNWTNVIFREGAPMQNVNLSARGANDLLSYSISGDYFKQDGILRGGSYERLSLRINNEYKLNRFVRIGHNFSIVNTKNTNAAGVIYDAYYAAPIISPNDSVGKFSNVNTESGVGNPAATQYYNRNSGGQSFRTVGNGFVDIQILRGLTYRSNFGLDWSSGESRSFTPVFFVTSVQQNQVSRLNASRGKGINKLWENTLNYDFSFAQKHRLNLLAGYTSQSFDGYSLSGSGANLLADVNDITRDLTDLLFITPTIVQGTRTVEEGSSAWRMTSQLYRLNYSFGDKYLLTASFRRDGSSLFGKDKRFGNFPSAALGWRLKEEAFFKNIHSLSNLKLRASWGIVGNGKIEQIAGDTKSPAVTGGLDAVFGVGEKFFPGATLLKLANPKLGWEETEQTDLGIEIGFWDNRFTAEIDRYRRQTNDILIQLPIPVFVGSESPPVVNAAKVLNSGWDITTSWRDRTKRAGLGYHISLNLSTVHNEVLSLGEGKEELVGGSVGEGGKLGTRTVVGLPIGAFYGYTVAGIYQNAEQLKSLPKRANETVGSDVKVGDLAYGDTNGDGVVTTTDRTFLGSPIPKLIFGLNLGVDWRGLDFSVQLNGVRGNKIINSKRLARFSTGNFEKTFLNRWTTEGSSSLEPRVTIGGRNYEVSERFIEDGAFTAIRNLQLGYTLPLSISRKLKMQNFRVYIAATNPKMWTSYTGYTPEIVNGSFDVLSVGIDRGVYPVAKTYSAGLSVSF
jgi:TonB-linked SusC/RagA family outer membrane protein